MEDQELVVQESGRFDLAHVDGTAALKQAEKMVQYLAAKCQGPQFVSVISGKKYPKVEWWTTVGAGLGLFPQEETCVRLDREGELAYEAVVSVRRSGEVISRASALCSNRERTWKSRDEYAIKSMATTRATGKAYRIAFSFLAVMAGLEATPAEEIPEDRPSPEEAREAALANLGTNQSDREKLDRGITMDSIAGIVKGEDFTDEDRDRYRGRVRAANTLGELKRVLEQASAEWKERIQKQEAGPVDAVAEAGWEATGKPEAKQAEIF